jgi:hypothetical protein
MTKFRFLFFERGLGRTFVPIYFSCSTKNPFRKLPSGLPTTPIAA